MLIHKFKKEYEKALNYHTKDIIIKDIEEKELNILNRKEYELCIRVCNFYLRKSSINEDEIEFIKSVKISSHRLYERTFK